MAGWEQRYLQGGNSLVGKSRIGIGVHLSDGIVQPGEGGHEAQVERPPPPEHLAPRGRQEDPVVQRDHHGGGGHHLLAAHAQPDGEHAGGVPRPAASGLRTADNAVQGQQVKQAHHRFAPLDDVRHTLRLQRVYQPEQGDGEGDPLGRLAEPVRQTGQPQRSGHDAEQGQAGAKMNEQVDRVVARLVEFAHGVVQGQRRNHDRAVGLGERGHQFRPGLDGAVLGDGVNVVQNEVAPEAGEIGDDRGRDQQCHQEPLQSAVV